MAPLAGDTPSASRVTVRRILGPGIKNATIRRASLEAEVPTVAMGPHIESGGANEGVGRHRLAGGVGGRLWSQDVSDLGPRWMALSRAKLKRPSTWNEDF